MTTLGSPPPPPPVHLSPPPQPLPPPPPASFDTAKGRLTKRGIGARVVTDSRERRMLGWETLVVLTVFPLPAVIAALVDLATHVTSGLRVTYVGLLVPNETALSVVLGVALAMSEMAAAGIVLYLLARSHEGAGAIGLGGRRLRMDLALVMIVWICVFNIPQGIGASLVRAWGLPTFHHAGPKPLALIVLQIALSISSGVVEEIVVLGYLVRRLEQRGWSTRAIVVIAVGVRVSYHLYYGPGVLPIVLWATVSVLMYLKIRRLLPFIICHIAWDVAISIGTYSHGVSGSLIGAFLLASIVMFIAWRKWSPLPVRSENPAAFLGS